MSHATATAAKKALLADALEYHLRYTVGKRENDATERDIFHALAHSVRDRLMDGMFKTEERFQAHDAKRLIYLSAEFLIGQSLRNNLFNLGLSKEADEATRRYGFSLEKIADSEPDAPLGNGGLGRLAACFMESLATLGMPAYGFGINYQFGLFKQEIENGHQKERPEQWVTADSPWLIERPAEVCTVPLYGRIEHANGRDGGYNPMWVDWQVIVGVPHDLPVVGFGGQTVNYLRLYSARASDDFDMQIFNSGDYIKAVERKISMETVSKVLYPSDAVASGKELRLIQEYFMVACALRDAIRKFRKDYPDAPLQQFSDHVAIQLNDTHPALAVAELMRLFVDEFDVPWESAWAITQATCGYTNHTLLPEALEKWPVPLMERVLPRHMQIIQEINHRFLQQVMVRFGDQQERIQRMSVIEEGGQKHVRMANLAIIGSHGINGVAALHSELVKTRLVPDFNELWPERFSNKTNGVTHRRWLASANPGLASLITRCAGKNWVADFPLIRKLESRASDSKFQNEFLAVKRHNKENLARLVLETEQITIDPASLFDVQIKRIHEYKRQLLNAMYVIHSYLSVVEDGRVPVVPRTHIFGGKAAPGYHMAKLIIKLINNIASVVNRDPHVSGLMKVVFMQDYRVTLAEKIIPAADLSEQLSTAGMEASGTGNMKFQMNGALTIGTLDGANVEIREEVGEENIYIFGLKAHEIEAARGSYSPWEYYHASPAIRRVVDSLVDDRFCPDEPGIFRPIYDALLSHGDYYFHLADFESYVAAQQRVSHDFLHRSDWARKAILNVARSAKFSSDRTVLEYARETWGIKSIGV
ncbi:MAG TPA: glycogen/starch/alpha-glucan phosphorylase [Candidatus Angelobacter sp.]|nr:glycogen/starch/alpha-glucan phosphorylase [Candidatus Angelobacter sp.]